MCVRVCWTNRVCVDRQGKAVEAAGITGDATVETGMPGYTSFVCDRTCALGRKWSDGASGLTGLVALLCRADRYRCVCLAGLTKLGLSLFPLSL